MNNDRRAWQTVAAMSRMVLQASGDDAHLVLDQMLVGALFNKKEPQAVGDAHPRGDVLQRLLGKLLLFTHVVRPTENVSVPRLLATLQRQPRQHWQRMTQPLHAACCCAASCHQTKHGYVDQHARDRGLWRLSFSA